MCQLPQHLPCKIVEPRQTLLLASCLCQRIFVATGKAAESLGWQSAAHTPLIFSQLWEVTSQMITSVTTESSEGDSMVRGRDWDTPYNQL